MSISTQVVDGEIMSGCVHFQEKSKVRSHSEDYEEDAIQ